MIKAIILQMVLGLTICFATGAVVLDICEWYLGAREKDDDL